MGLTSSGCAQAALQTESVPPDGCTRREGTRRGIEGEEPAKSGPALAAVVSPRREATSEDMYPEYVDGAPDGACDDHSAAFPLVRAAVSRKPNKRERRRQRHSSGPAPAVVVSPRRGAATEDTKLEYVDGACDDKSGAVLTAEVSPAPLGESLLSIKTRFGT